MVDASKYRILVIDDEYPVRELISQIVKREGFSCDTAEDVDSALELIEKNEYSLLISDINMPGKTGIDLLNSLADYDKPLAILMATAENDRKVAIHTMELGAYGYLIKPFDRNELLINVANALYRLELGINNRQYSESLEEMVRERTERLREAEKEIEDSRAETIFRLAKAAEFRDNETAQHTVRMGEYCAVVARKLGLDAEVSERIRQASPLHDVGKIGIPDQILLKPGRLTEEEFEVIKTHPEIGYRILDGSRSEFLIMGANIAYTHHEKWDGSGYPRGLSGEDIPIEGRIAAVCDVFDALTSDRVYKAAMSPEKAVDILTEGRGSHFDPACLDAFVDSIAEILTLKHKFADG